MAFEIGLVLAGAVSGGAYTAGVLDFLVEALDEWAVHRPPGGHDIALKVVAGTSAGAICAPLAALELTRQRASRATNALYRAWVVEPDIQRLCQANDLRGTALPSLLDSSTLDDIAAEIRLDTRERQSRDYAKAVTFLVTSTNLRGVPYFIQFNGSERFDMLSHADHMVFTYAGTGGENPFDPRPDDANWALFIEAALASSAFPVGLAARSLSRPFESYGKRSWPVSMPAENGLYRIDARVLEPNWPTPRGARYSYMNVDGGLFDNEPLELARAALGGGGRNPRDGNEACRATIMVNPFFAPLPPIDSLAGPNLDVFQALAATVGAVQRQQRFKPEEIALALDETVFSRFLVAPKEDGKPTALASAPVGHFGGFLHQRFREHDFELGRRNCQRFLQERFVLPAENPLFGAASAGRPAGSFLPILPLVGSAAREVPKPRCEPIRADEWAAIAAAIRARIDSVVQHVIENEVTARGLAMALRGAWWLARQRLGEALVKRIEAQLDASLLERSPA